MGYNTYHHFGAYIEMPKIEETTTKTIRRCTAKSCTSKSKKLPENSHFCNECGAKVEHFEQINKVTNMLDYYSFAEENGLDPEVFAQVQRDLMLIPNRRFGTVARWEEDEEKTVELVWGDSREALVKFTKEAKEFIHKVKEVYGIELQVKFGIVSYSI